MARLLKAAERIHEHFKRERDEAVYDYANVALTALLSMLVHGVYFRDLDELGDIAAKFLGYQDGRAENYTRRHWRQYRPSALRLLDPAELRDLGLEFLLRVDPHPNHSAPRLAIVLRGTIPHNVRDLAADWNIGISRLDRTARVLRCRELISVVVKAFRSEVRDGDQRLCLTGHSLGAAIALLVGAALFCFEDVHIDTHVFHPPFLTLVDNVRAFPRPTAPQNYPTTSRSDQVAMLWSEVFAEEEALTEEWMRFRKLQNWVPHFYLNPKDTICRLYIKYYKERHGNVTEPAHVISLQGILTHLFSRNTMIINVVPSADLHISYHYNDNPLRAHSLRQWHKHFGKSLVEHFQARLLRSQRESRVR